MQLYLFIICLVVFLFAMKKLSGCYVEQYILLSLFIVMELVPFLYIILIDYDITNNIYSRSIMQLTLFGNFLLFSIVLIYAKPSKEYLPINNSQSKSEPAFLLESDIFQESKKFPSGIITLILISWLIFSLYLLISSITFSLSDSRTDAWAEIVQDEASYGAGFWGVIQMLFNGLFWVALHDALTSKDIKLRNLGIRSLQIITLLSVAITLKSGMYRSPAIFNILFGLIIYHLYVAQIDLKKYLSIGIICVPFYMSFAAYVREGDVDKSNANYLHGLSGVATAFDYEFLIYLLQHDEIQYENGLQYTYNLISFVPRFIWPDKPSTSFSWRMSEKIYGTIGKKAWVHTYTPWGEGYAQFGVIGTVINTIILCIIYSYLKKFVFNNPRYIINVVSIFLVGLPILLRGDLSVFFGAIYRLLFISIFVNFVHLFF